MSDSGPVFWDRESVFAGYMARGARQDNPNDTLEWPVIRELQGDVARKRVLDLGCGDASYGWKVLQQGCRGYVGVDGSPKMVAAAQQTLAGTTGRVIHSNIEEWEYPASAFDLAVARLVFHYIADIDRMFACVFQTLTEGGRLIFSVEHPVITSCDRGWEAGSARQDWIVDEYFETGLRIVDWKGGQVRKYHRTVEGYCRALQAAGFQLEALRESHPQREYFTDAATYERRKRIPLFLFLVGSKPVAPSD